MGEFNVLPRRANEVVNLVDDLASFDPHQPNSTGAVFVAIGCFKIYGNKIVYTKRAIAGR